MGWNPKFDLDLQYGQDGENWLRWLGTDQARVEVKTERDTWYTTGNVVFEYRSRGKPSGIATTESDWWVQVLKLGDETHACFVFNVIYMKENLRAMFRNPGAYGCRLVRGGDNLTSDVILVPVSQLYRLGLGGVRTGDAKSQ